MCFQLLMVTRIVTQASRIIHHILQSVQFPNPHQVVIWSGSTPSDPVSDRVEQVVRGHSKNLFCRLYFGKSAAPNEMAPPDRKSSTAGIRGGFSNHRIAVFTLRKKAVRLIYYLVTKPFSNTIRSFLATWGKALKPRVRVIHYRKAFRQRQFSPGTYIFSDIERLSVRETEYAASIHHALTARWGNRFTILNHPTRSMKRYELLRALYHAGINSHNAFRLPKDGYLRNILSLSVVRMTTGARSPR